MTEEAEEQLPEGPPNEARAVVLGMEDALDAAARARDPKHPLHKTHPAVTIHRSDGENADEGSSAYGIRTRQCISEDWPLASWNAYCRAFIAQLGAMEVAMVSQARDDSVTVVWVVDL